MKRIIILLLILLCSINAVLADEKDNLYENAKPFGTTLYNDIDPFEDEEALIYAYNPYPLFRTSAYLYFKNMTLSPGYYTLTPRKLKGEYYVLFKQGGKVKYIIPVAKKEMTPVNFYKANIPERKKTIGQKISGAISNKFYTVFRKSQKVPPPKSYLKVDVDSIYITVMVYYGVDKYTIIFKRSPY